MIRELWQDGEMERKLSHPMEGLRGVCVPTADYSTFTFQGEDIDMLEIFSPIPKYRNPLNLNMKKYFYADGGIRIRFRPSANNMSRFDGYAYSNHGIMTTEGVTSESVMVPGYTGYRYCLPFELLRKFQDISLLRLFYKRPWLYYDGTWDESIAKCILVSVPYIEKHNNIGNWQAWPEENALQSSWIDSKGRMNIVIRSAWEDAIE